MNSFPSISQVKSCLIFFAVALLFFAFSPLSRAQTNTPDVSIPATNAPADSAAATNLPAASAPATDTPADSAPSIPIAPMIHSSINGAQGQASPDAGLEDIRPPIFYLNPWFWLWILVAAVIIAIALLILLLFLFRPNRQLTAKSAYELALEKLEKARALLQEDNPIPYAVFVSETIRSYLGQRFQAPSTRRTTEEFLRQMEADINTPLAEHRDLLRTFLQSCDLVKFARYQPTLTELEQVQGRAYTFVTATKPLPASAPQNGRHAP
jgi:hypothetical protein